MHAAEISSRDTEKKKNGRKLRKVQSSVRIERMKSDYFARVT